MRLTIGLVSLALMPVAGCGCSGPPDQGRVVFALDLDDTEVGPYTEAQLDADWNGPTWSGGVAEGRVEVVATVDGEGRSLRVHYPAGTYGPADGGAQWFLDLDGPFDELVCSYRVRFGEGFDFVKGGKLPGLVGGEANSGGDPPDGTDGFSARLMWREGGEIVQYVYHPDQPGTWGEDLPWDEGGQRVLIPGHWHTLEHRVVTNTPGQHDGVIEAWFDGALALSRTDLRFRDTDTFAIDALYFSTFFGGGDETWATTQDEHIDFDDFEVRNERE